MDREVSVIEVRRVSRVSLVGRACAAGRAAQMAGLVTTTTSVGAVVDAFRSLPKPRSVASTRYELSPTYRMVERVCRDLCGIRW